MTILTFLFVESDYQQILKKFDEIICLRQQKLENGSSYSLELTRKTPSKLSKLTLPTLPPDLVELEKTCFEKFSRV